MARRAIREYQGKMLINKFFKEYVPEPWKYPFSSVEIGPDTNLEKIADENPWLKNEKLVIKPDQIIGKRGKGELIKLNADLNEAISFIKNLRNKKIKIQDIEGEINYFIIEKYVPHNKEYYLAFNVKRDADQVLVSSHGGVDIEENWENVRQIEVPVEQEITSVNFEPLVVDFPKEIQSKLINLIRGLYQLFVDLHFTFFEINPFVIDGDKFIPLDFKGRLDDTAFFEVGEKWGEIEFPTPFGRNYLPEEKYIRSLDEKTGASLKLTILNPKGRIWTMVAGGGASVIYADTVIDLGYGAELANYGEYSGNPNEEFTYLYAKTILDLMTREKDPKNRSKILLIGGGIANFTDVAETFKGIIKAIREYADKLVRRGGPNYKEGLKNMKKLGEELKLPIQVYGPETHMTRIVKIALEEK
ncbi:MAG: ATP citrate lyase citrate-binding domain-containing protein [Candidatus Odinarchaeia archaeon]